MGVRRAWGGAGFGGNYPRGPSRCSSTVGWHTGNSVETRPGEGPCDDRVRVPHLSGSEFVAAPYWGGNVREVVEHLLYEWRGVRDVNRAVQRRVDFDIILIPAVGRDLVLCQPGFADRTIQTVIGPNGILRERPSSREEY